MSEWKPIDTAPKNGGLFLAWLDDEGFDTLARWDAKEAMWYLPDMDMWQSNDGLHLITHWKPLSGVASEGRLS